MEQFSSAARQLNLARMRDEQFDVLVIGGGVTGAGVALDAVARGYKVALVEKADFAGPRTVTASESTPGPSTAPAPTAVPTAVPTALATTRGK